jgi:hypothetical protein
LIFIWSLQGAPGFWAMSVQGRQDPLLQDWWCREVPAMIESRRRFIAGDAADLAGLGAI